MKLKGSYSQKSPQIKFILFCTLFLLSFIFFFLTSNTLSVLFGDFSSLENINSDDLVYLKILQALSSISIFIIPPLLFSYLTDFKYHIKQKIDRQSILLIVSIIILINPLIYFFSQINQNIVLPEFALGIELWMKEAEDKAYKITQSFLIMNNINDLLINLVVIAMIPAIGEELFFRGLIQKNFCRISSNEHLAVMITAFLFSAIHMQFFTFFPRFILGIILGYLYFWSKNLWIPILTHFLNNAQVVIFYYFFSNNHNVLSEFGYSQNQDLNIKTEVILFSFIAVSILLFLMYRHQHNIVKHDDRNEKN